MTHLLALFLCPFIAEPPQKPFDSPWPWLEQAGMRLGVLDSRAPPLYADNAVTAAGILAKRWLEMQLFFPPLSDVKRLPTVSECRHREQVTAYDCRELRAQAHQDGLVGLPGILREALLHDLERAHCIALHMDLAKRDRRASEYERRRHLAMLRDLDPAAYTLGQWADPPGNPFSH